MASQHKIKKMKNGYLCEICKSESYNISPVCKSCGSTKTNWISIADKKLYDSNGKIISVPGKSPIKKGYLCEICKSESDSVSLVCKSCGSTKTNWISIADKKLYDSNGKIISVPGKSPINKKAIIIIVSLFIIILVSVIYFFTDKGGDTNMIQSTETIMNDGVDNIRISKFLLGSYNGIIITEAGKNKAVLIIDNITDDSICKAILNVYSGDLKLKYQRSRIIFTIVNNKIKSTDLGNGKLVVSDDQIQLINNSKNNPYNFIKFE